MPLPTAPRRAATPNQTQPTPNEPTPISAVTPPTNPTPTKTPTKTSIIIARTNTEHFLDPNNPNLYKEYKELIQHYTTEAHEHIKTIGQTESVANARKGNNDLREELTHTISNFLLHRLGAEQPTLRGPNRNFLITAILDEILGLGPIEPLWRDHTISDIYVNGPNNIDIKRDGVNHRIHGISFHDSDHLLELAQKILGLSNRRVDISKPITDGRLPDQSRVHVVHPVIAQTGPSVVIRRHREERWTVKELIDRGSFNEEMLEDLAWLIHSGCSSVIIGGTGTGKTTMLNALSGLFPNGDRIITIEDNLELKIDPSRLCAPPMETRDAGASGEGGITIRDLVKASLRMGPDRIIVGEVRDAAAFDMLQAMNTGHDGSMTTIHSNDAQAGVTRLVDMLQQAGDIADTNSALNLVSASVDLFVVLQRFTEDGSLRTVGIYEIPQRPTLDENGYNLNPIPLWEYRHTSTDPETNKVIGHWEKLGEPSEWLRRKHRLDQKPKLTIEEIYQFVGV